ncbi:MAG: tyrosinase family protein [Chloroflexi bacterium]|nr:tyrosinase family protein [Chloroflexota bacterium]
MTCRKSWARLTTAEKKNFIAALLKLKNDAAWPSVLFPGDSNMHRYDDYVALHLRAMSVMPSWAHMAPAFFSWHRDLMRHFEANLQTIDSTVSIPYWDWNLYRGTGAPIFDADPLSGLGTNGRASDGRVMDGAFAFDAGNWTIRIKDSPGNPSFLGRRFGERADAQNLNSIPGDQVTALAQTAYDAAPWDDMASGGGGDSLRIQVEYQLHNLVHRWLARTMYLASSPNDPVFWLHHCNIDRLWAVWQRQHPTADAYLPPSGAPLGHNAGDNLIFNDAMFPTAPWAGARTSASLINHHAITPGGYWYDDDPPEVISKTSSVAFTDIQEGIGGTPVTTYRAVVLKVVPGPCNAITLEIIAGPSAGLGTPLGTSVVIPTSDDPTPTKGRIWISYSTAAGTISVGSLTVRATSHNSAGETVWTETWGVNLSANSVPRQPSAVALVLDRSGSMSDDSGDGQAKVDKLREAVGVFLEVMQEGDGIGIVRFDHEVNRLLDVTDVGPLPPVAGTGRDRVADILATSDPAKTLDPRGATSIGGGVAEGRDTLDATPAGTYGALGMLVLTDGNENTPPSIATVDSAGSIGADTFAIGFGTAGNVSEDALDSLTHQNGGSLLVTGAIGQSERFLLSKYFLQIQAGFTNAQIVVDPVGQLVFGAEHRIPFWLTEADAGVDVLLLSPAPEYIEFSLETPAGVIVDPSTGTIEPAVRFVERPHISFYRLSLPALGGSPEGSHAGEWHVVLRLNERAKDADRALVAELGSQALPYSLEIHANSNLHFLAEAIQKTHQPGSDVWLSATLSEYDTPVEGRATVWSEVEWPNGTETTVKFMEVEGGRFSADFTATAVGVYRIVVYARGTTLFGRPFSRERSLSASVFREQGKVDEQDAMRIGRMKESQDPMSAPADRESRRGAAARRIRKAVREPREPGRDVESKPGFAELDVPRPRPITVRHRMAMPLFPTLEEMDARRGKHSMPAETDETKHPPDESS